MNWAEKPHIGLVNPAWRSHPVWKDVVEVLPMLEGGGNTTEDLCRVEGRATFVGGPTWKHNDYGPCIELGDSVYLNPNRWASEMDAGDITFMYWCTTTAAGTLMWLTRRLGLSSKVILVGTDVDGYWEYYSKPGGGTNTSGTTITPVDGVLYCVIATSNQNDGSHLYVDGVEIGNDVTILSDTGLQDIPYYVGHTTSLSWRGTISAMALWDRGISPAEVKELYRRGPSLGLEDSSELPILTASPAGASSFEAAWAFNSNQVL